MRRNILWQFPVLAVWGISAAFAGEAVSGLGLVDSQLLPGDRVLIGTVLGGQRRSGTD